MAGLSQYLQAEITNWIRGTAFDTAPASLELALSENALNDSGSNITEPSGANGYARQTVTFDPIVHTEGDGTTMINTSAIVFGPVVNVAWNTIVAAAVFDNSGNMLYQGTLAVARAAPIGDTLSWGIGTLELKLV